MTLKVDMLHRVLEYYQDCSNDAPVLTVTFGPLCFCMGKSKKKIDSSESIEVYDIKVGRFKGRMTLQLGMQHWVHKYYQVWSNDDSGLTMTYFMARSNFVPYAFI